MAKFLVGGTARFSFEIEVEAHDEEGAVSEVEDMMALGDLLEASSDDDIEVDYADPVVGPRGTVTKAD